MTSVCPPAQCCSVTPPMLAVPPSGHQLEGASALADRVTQPAGGVQ